MSSESTGQSTTSFSRWRLVAVLLAIAAVGGIGMFAWLVFFQGEDGGREIAVGAEKEGGKESSTPPVDLLLPDKPDFDLFRPPVRKALNAGIAFLRKQLDTQEGGLTGVFPPLVRDGHDRRPGLNALVGLTLLQCEAPESDPDVLRIANALRKQASVLSTTDSVAATILFLDRMKFPEQAADEDRELVKSLGLRLIAGQIRETSLWGNKVPILNREDETKLLNELKAGTNQLAASGTYNLADSQIASLALWTAARYNVPTDAALLAAAKSIRKLQNADGTWTCPTSGGTGMKDSATCSGLIFLGMGKALANKKIGNDLSSKDPDPAINKALEHLAKVIKSRRVDFSAPSDLYFLRALERVELVYNVRYLGGVDCIEWGADIILPQQQADGSWKQGSISDTCFAMLFLTRQRFFRDLS